MKGKHQFKHEYQNPKNKWQETLYTVNFDKLTQWNPDSGKERKVRLVAFAKLRCGAPEGGTPTQQIQEGGYQEGGSKASGSQQAA